MGMTDEMKKVAGQMKKYVSHHDVSMSDSNDLLCGWTDPRPQLPPDGVLVEVKCSDGSVRKALIEDTWGGRIWKYGHGGCEKWSMGHPRIIGWREFT